MEPLSGVPLTAYPSLSSRVNTPGNRPLSTPTIAKLTGRPAFVPSPTIVTLWEISSNVAAVIELEWKSVPEPASCSSTDSGKPSPSHTSRSKWKRALPKVRPLTVPSPSASWQIWNGGVGRAGLKSYAGATSTRLNGTPPTPLRLGTVSAGAARLIELAVTLYRTLLMGFGSLTAEAGTVMVMTPGVVAVYEPVTRVDPG